MASLTPAHSTSPASPPLRLPWAWIGVAPFLLFAVLFLILPTAFLVVGAFRDADGHLRPLPAATATPPPAT